MQNPTYRFQFNDGTTACFESGGASAAQEVLPAWTELGFHQCSNCPLAAQATRHCPMAASFVPLVAVFDGRHSYDTVTVTVESSERLVSKTTSVQQAAGSLMGLLSARSGCPRTGFLKPMARFHLPFATEQETIYRVASMYLLAQYFVRGQGGAPDWDLAALRTHYEELHQVNMAMSARLRAVSKQDGALNALVLLDLLAKVLPYSIDDALEDVRSVFE